MAPSESFVYPFAGSFCAACIMTEPFNFHADSFHEQRACGFKVSRHLYREKQFSGVEKV